MDDRFNIRAFARAHDSGDSGRDPGQRRRRPIGQGAVDLAPDASQGLRFDPSLSLDPTLPQVGAMPGGLTPAFGQRSLSEGEWRFDFHGYIVAPMNMGFNTRPNPLPGQSKTVLHAPPVVPDDLETFSHTGVVPTTYVQLNFSEGNSIVTANVSILAKQANVSESFLEPADQLGITDVFLSVLPPLGERVHMQALLGAFTLRYGSTGEYDEGRYGTPLIARINGVGEHVALQDRMAQVLLCARRGRARPDQHRLGHRHAGRVEQLRRSGRGQHLRGPCARGRGLRQPGHGGHGRGTFLACLQSGRSGRDLGP